EARLDLGDARIARRLIPWVRGFAGLEAMTRGSVSFTWRVGAAPPIAPADATPGAIADYYHLTGTIEEGRVVYRTTDGGWMALAADGDRVDFLVPESMLTGPDWSLRDLFSAAITSLLRRQGRFPIHAAGVARGAAALATGEAGVGSPPAGVLIVGAPMAGKTSLALNFIRRGWTWLSDDKIALEGAAEGVRMSGLYRPANVDPALARWFPEMSGIESRAPAFPNSEKRSVAIDAIYGHSAFSGADSAPARVTHLLFPRVVDIGPTRLTPLTPGEALVRMMTQSPIHADRDDARRQLALLSRLAGSAAAFAIDAGRDLLDSPDTLVTAGRTMGLAIDLPVTSPPV
ncbi:MAG TPA: hypothetical protein VF720_14965, partial [Candidatus Eisenbacteria bacterium]